MYSPKALQVDNHERSIYWLAGRDSRGREDLSRERVGINEECLPEAFRRDALVQLGDVDASEVVYVERAALFVGLRDESG